MNRDDEMIRLWTIQTQAKWERAQKFGWLSGDGRFVIRDFRPAYRWMREQLRQRCKPCQGLSYPIWAWYAPKPDLRMSSHLPRGTEGVRIEFMALKQRVLLSDFQAWHAVLMNTEVSLSEEEQEAFYRRKEDAEGDFGMTARHNALTQQSWERIFDLELLRTTGYWGDGTMIQATLETVLLRDIVTVTPFVAR